MKDEIKEILECIKDKKRDYVGTNGCLYQDLDRKELNLLLDYINNLQEENKRLNNIIENIDTYIHLWKLEEIGEKTMLILNDILLIKNGMSNEVIRLKEVNKE